MAKRSKWPKSWFNEIDHPCRQHETVLEVEEHQEFEDDHGVHHLDFRVVVEAVVLPHPDDKDHLLVDHPLGVDRHQDVDRLLRQGVVQEVLDDPQDVLLQEDLEVLDVHLQGDHLQEDVGGSIPVLQVRLLHRDNFLV